ncbi:gliding motility lipoprotein GldK [Tenacibaculum maritimum]|uniref:Gliding motility lipoprotein GldK n=1 Tax=Tenacibaculum maritimum NCIMB 2154 TaxID=1349785 RepID=A0A2H1E7N1_9FLAO|nr:gliding motility lipoprotein GldK [Tenacibaculum maritimum]MCD9562016.1 gliding motility lipoprotein GldK [Tenacibaculum maritimum]MCD9565100.1 gliding motility lipoprotein GldK [Tenacibaculum maritimum]MCD9579073.1 gliding motility lipoprotein GldK [Tenacibaculum maritimum]MCD9581733.1 gliding motility lipoprotein GldK [Tenacibaculum maritimum]MCD9583894.1 gliding motility lipoprotein GldK [Tenacibaculum maritimum]
MKKIVVFALLVSIVYGCGSSNDRGELVGVKSKRKWFAEKPYGMALIPGGSFTMGKQDEDPLGAMNAPTKTVTVQPFYMDESEITNSEYKKFVVWVRDSVTRTKLAYQAEFAAGDNDPANVGKKAQGIQRYAFASADTINESPYQKYMRENYYELGEGIDSLKPLNWEEKLIWEKDEYPDVDYVEVMDSLYIKKDEALNGIRTFNTKLLNYRYFWFDNEQAARTGKSRKDFMRDEVLNIYPDTTVWIKDFNYSYNDPMHQEYFAHKAYEEYPVVGINWYQARAFCHWRTQIKNTYQRSKKNLGLVPSFRLPTEAEWEYAARGGLNYAKYPWGGPNTTSDRGCFLANFKPVRGDYAADGALYTMEAVSFNPNEYGLYNMAGNVAEWTNTAYNQMSYYMGSTMNPNVENRENQRKIIRGGSWKDVAYFLEVGSRDWEYADTARSYIGFRTVQDYLGTKKN